MVEGQKLIWDVLTTGEVNLCKSIFDVRKVGWI